jgi:hypothetical protein
VLNQYLLPAAQTSNTVNLAAQMYAMVAFEGGYSFWDTVTAADLGNITVATSGGYPINVAQTVNVTAFYDYLVQQLSSLG